MSKKSKSIKTKIITGYVLLSVVGAVSILFLYNEILKWGKPKSEIFSRNQQLIDLSDALTNSIQQKLQKEILLYLSRKLNFRITISLLTVLSIKCKVLKNTKVA